ncbi:NUDIX hydrolase [Paenibacillus thalictri]|uniref:8-oxo-dGTP diphosphatase n=1 Tax=Paenibacillus thalictri TaxID=2527873 RepID=A0A4Q9DGH0_9BACL|nr:8-oxo-dGTP diphosphatase [Paenibacillus thalictri]TBL71252.1 8-oxo-dGTP diphosphatase [Paenibacillus thalictri]
MLKYTICFIRQGDRVLMLNRNEAPLRGTWNGVGGKLEPGETPHEGIVREIVEETGLMMPPNAVRFTGIVTWELEGRENGGMYVYIAELKDHIEFHTPVEMNEGLLAWKPVEWVVKADNAGVAAHVRHFLPSMLVESELKEYRCTFIDGKLISCRRMNLPEWIDQAGCLGLEGDAR